MTNQSIINKQTIINDLKKSFINFNDFSNVFKSFLIDIEYRNKIFNIKNDNNCEIVNETLNEITYIDHSILYDDIIDFD